MKIKQLYPFLIVLLGILVGNLGSYCGVYECILHSAFYSHVFTFFDPVLIFSLFSIPAVLFLPFVNKKTFSIWMKFAIVWLLLSLYIIANSPVAMNAWFYVFDYSRSNTARLLAIAFSGISLVLIAIAALTTRKKR